MNALKPKDLPPAGQSPAPTLDRDELLHAKRGYWALRRGQDILLSILALAVLWPWMLLLALIIYLDDPHGSPFFAQTRCGRDGKPFRLYKFRTMCVGAEQQLDRLMEHNEMDGPVFKIKGDPRITKVGRFIRKTGLDELPQLWNILRGDMSIVGPRPPLPREVALYNAYQFQRLYIQPGLTCYWQVQPRRNEISFEEWVELDLKYIRERSFLVDWKIIFLTFKAVLRRQGE